MKRLKALGISLCIFLAGCQTVSTTNSGTIGVQREQKMFSLLSESQVNAMSAEAYREALNIARKKEVLNRKPADVKRLRTIADRLVSHVGVFRPDARSWNWEVNLMTDKQLNAYCMPGGKIMFYTGIIDTLKLTDDEIAAIMGHEMAHALREHGREAMSQAYAVQLGQDTLGILLGVSPEIISVGSTVVNYALTLPNSRTNEAEADLIGLELMARAGYNPRAAVSLWKKMSAQSDGSVPEFMSTHPSHNTRINGLKANIAKVDHLYQQAISKTN
ncbi:M48 family metallopeptidase [Endozoicomonas sp. SCSIO W0465]|uniref:M48 family metallopeptidase n=1 Tax=Endozoicomonas sp. SCSIO W0465 TaxID=2918516 RepID=UPI002075C8B2|nr:M48 family metallopeptidase [Endozoicomonas sp. SCSIO W0465]USE38161.1 M48 family metallopeptidase [Endozoicomonas sp. SCSIO W0465]